MTDESFAIYPKRFGCIGKIACSFNNLAISGIRINVKVDDFDKTIPPRRAASDDMDDVIMPGKRDRKPDGRFAVGDLIMNRYKVLAELDQGGVGVVYKCFDENAGIEVALKALPPELSHNTLEMEDIKENFQLVHNLHHPNIAVSNNLERDDSNGDYYLIMECAEDEDLQRWLCRKSKDGNMSFSDILAIVEQVASPRDYAHAPKVLHRDIKPGNIMIATCDANLRLFPLACIKCYDRLSSEEKQILDDKYNSKEINLLTK